MERGNHYLNFLLSSCCRERYWGEQKWNGQVIQTERSMARNAIKDTIHFERRREGLSWRTEWFYPLVEEGERMSCPSNLDLPFLQPNISLIQFWKKEEEKQDQRMFISHIIPSISKTCSWPFSTWRPQEDSPLHVSPEKVGWKADGKEMRVERQIGEWHLKWEGTKKRRGSNS